MSVGGSFEGWAIIELMGHRRLAGYVREETLAGQGLLRLDVPGDDGVTMATQYYHPNALYCLTPTTEEIARGLAARVKPEPVTRYDLPRLPAGRLPAVSEDVEPPDDDFEDEDEDDEL